MTDARSRRRRTLVAFLAAISALTLVGVAPSPAPAATKPCGDQVVDDWYGNGRVDRIFPLRCYQEAIRSLPVDVLDYSNAKEDILRALQFARQNKPDPGPSGGEAPTDTSGSEDPGDDDPLGSPPGSDDPTGTVAAPPADTSGPSSIPIPLFILGGLALLLLAAGAAGYLSRRAQARRGGPPGPPGPA